MGTEILINYSKKKKKKEPTYLEETNSLKLVRPYKFKFMEKRVNNLESISNNQRINMSQWSQKERSFYPTIRIKHKRFMYPKHSQNSTGRAN